MLFMEVRFKLQMVSQTVNSLKHLYFHLPYSVRLFPNPSRFSQELQFF